MAQDEQFSNNKSKNNSNKQNKVPQRGLGVAQLEKIRLDEQRKKEALKAANVLAKSAIQTPHFRPNVSISSTKFETRDQNSVHVTNELNLGREKQRVDHFVFGFGKQVNVPYESNSSILPMRSQYQPPSMVNSGISPSSIEPPSNQSFRSNGFTSSWPQEDKIVGTKRSYPFDLESPRGVSIRCNLNGHDASRSRSDDLSNTEPINKYIRDGTSNSSPLPERGPDDDGLNGDHLTLAPPVCSSRPLNSKGKQSLKESGQSVWWGPFGSMEQRAFSFFPDKPQTDESTRARVSNGDGEKAETIDLDLKL